MGPSPRAPTTWTWYTARSRVDRRGRISRRRKRLPISSRHDPFPELVDTAHDLSGGEAVALAEMALAGRVGFEYEGHEIEGIIGAGGEAEILFGEGHVFWSQSRKSGGTICRTPGRCGLRHGRNYRRGQVQDQRSRRREFARSQESIRADLFGAPEGGGDSLSVDKVNIEEKLALIDERWKPKIVGELNGQYVKLVKFIGEFVWHHHDDEDELFLVVKALPDGVPGQERLDRGGEFIVVPRGSSIAPWPRRRRTCCSSSPPRR